MIQSVQMEQHYNETMKFDGGKNECQASRKVEVRLSLWGWAHENGSYCAFLYACVLVKLLRYSNEPLACIIGREDGHQSTSEYLMHNLNSFRANLAASLIGPPLICKSSSHIESVELSPHSLKPKCFLGRA